MLKDKIEKEYKKKYKSGYADRADYKLAMLFCKMLPEMDVSVGFPDYLLADNFELFYELATTDAFFESEGVRLAYMNFIEQAIKTGAPKNLIFDIFDGLTNSGIKADKSKFKPLTKQYYNEYLTKRSKTWN